MTHLQQAETRLDNLLKGDSPFPVIRDIVEHLKQETKFGFYQLCPKCDGEGQVPNIGTSSSMHRICPVCNGAKMLVRPEIKTYPPTKQATGFDTDKFE